MGHMTGHFDILPPNYESFTPAMKAQLATTTASMFPKKPSPAWDPYTGKPFGEYAYGTPGAPTLGGGLSALELEEAEYPSPQPSGLALSMAGMGTKQGGIPVTPPTNGGATSVTPFPGVVMPSNDPLTGLPIPVPQSTIGNLPEDWDFPFDQPMNGSTVRRPSLDFLKKLLAPGLQTTPTTTPTGESPISRPSLDFLKKLLAPGLQTTPTTTPTGESPISRPSLDFLKKLLVPTAKTDMPTPPTDPGPGPGQETEGPGGLTGLEAEEAQYPSPPRSPEAGVTAVPTPSGVPPAAALAGIGTTPKIMPSWPADPTTEQQKRTQAREAEEAEYPSPFPPSGSALERAKRGDPLVPTPEKAKNGDKIGDPIVPTPKDGKDLVDGKDDPAYTTQGFNYLVGEVYKSVFEGDGNYPPEGLRFITVTTRNQIGIDPNTGEGIFDTSTERFLSPQSEVLWDYYTALTAQREEQQREARQFLTSLLESPAAMAAFQTMSGGQMPDVFSRMGFQPAQIPGGQLSPNILQERGLFPGGTPPVGALSQLQEPQWQQLLGGLGVYGVTPSQFTQESQRITPATFGGITRSTEDGVNVLSTPGRGRVR